MPPAPSTPIACPVTVTTLTKSTPRNLSDDIETESAPSTAPTDYYERLPTYHCEKNEKTPLDWQLCQGLSIDQITNLIINYKISSALSIMGSIYVIQDVLWDPKKRKESTYHRIMVGLSCSDIIFSFFGPFLGSWVMPTGSQIFAAGSHIACAVAGFFMTMAVPCTPLYNCSLATFYLLRLKFQWVSREIVAIEKWLLYLPCIAGLISAIVAAIVSIFAPYGLNCT